MTDFHVKACDGGIVAGVLRKDGEFGKQHSVVTDEALIAVRDYLLCTLPEGNNQRVLLWQGTEGVAVALTLTIMEVVQPEITEETESSVSSEEVAEPLPDNVVDFNSPS